MQTIGVISKGGIKMRTKVVQVIAMVALILGLSLAPALVSRASFSDDGSFAAPTAIDGGRSSAH